MLNSIIEGRFFQILRKVYWGLLLTEKPADVLLKKKIYNFYDLCYTNRFFFFTDLNPILLWCNENLNNYTFFYKQRFFSTLPQFWLTFSWIELQTLLRCCLIHVSIIMLRHFLYLVDLCSYLGLGLFIITLKQTHLLISILFIIGPIIFRW